MFILILCALGWAVALTVNARSRYSPDWTMGLKIASTIVGVMIGFVLLINPIEEQANVAEFQSVQISLNNARQNGNPLESVTLQLKVIEMNEWLASVQYYNSLFFFGDFVPNTVDDLEPIQ